MSDLAFDARASLRRLRQHPLLALLAAGTLGLGLGVAVALLAVVDALYIRPLPLDREKEVAVIRAEPDGPLSRADMNDLLARTPAFGGMRDWSFSLRTPSGREPLSGALATPGLFDVFRVRPHLGRLFTAEDDRAGAARVALLTYASWQQRFHGDRAIVGRSVDCGDVYTIVGVLPQNFVAPSFREADLWAPLSIDPDSPRGRGFRNLKVYARVPHGDVDALQHEVAFGAQRLARQHPDTNRDWSARAVPLIAFELGGVLQQLAAIGVAVVLLLGMAIAALSSIVVADTMSRRSELGLRAALGGSRARLMRELLLDNVLLCAIGGFTAAIVAALLLTTMQRFAASSIPRFEEIAPNGRMLFAAVVATLAIAAAFAAALIAWVGRGEPAEHIRSSSRTFTSSARDASGWLVATQVTFAFVLLALVVASARGYYARITTAWGFDPDGVTLLRVRAGEVPRRSQLIANAAAAADAVAALPGASSATIVSSGPMFGAQEEIEIATDGASPLTMARYANVDSRYFTTLGIPLVAGRGFTSADDERRGSAIIISRVLAARLFGGDAIGKQLWIGAEKRHPYEIIGVACDVADSRAGRSGVAVYFPFAQDPRGLFFIAVRGDVTAPAAVAAVRRTLPDALVMSTTTMNEAIDRDRVAPRLQLLLLAIFAGGAVVLSGVAVYGMVALISAKRRAELGLRMALGASPTSAMWLLLRTLALPVCAGLACGVAALTFVGREAFGAVPIAVSAAFIVVLALAASMHRLLAVASLEPAVALA